MKFPSGEKEVSFLPRNLEVLPRCPACYHGLRDTLDLEDMDYFGVCFI